LQEVTTAADSQPSMRWDAQRALANIREAQGDASGADNAYRSALALVESARSDLKQEESRLTFLVKATRIYDDYVHFLVTQGKTEEALEAADWSRARTLQQGLGLIASGVSIAPPKFNAVEIARKSNATLLFYWLGKRQSYLWVAGAGKLTLVPLPKASEITPMIDRYRQALLDLKDPLQDGNKDGRALYQTLVAPAASVISPNGRVVILADGPMSQMNFETLVATSPTPHYWIEDATLLSAPSIRLFASAKPADNAGGKLLLLGDSISPGPEYPALPMAAVEMEKVRSHSSLSSAVVFSLEQATPAAYLKSGPEQFSYIHFVTHGTANSVDPLESAVILSRQSAADDSYKLYARDILKHPINANLVTISACNSSGTRAVAGEGLIGLSWAFLRAGAHNAIGSLWEVGDMSTPQLMDRLYSGLERGEQPADALREAKLAQIHSEDAVRKPFYWAPFQLYAGR
jgi:CHAT domain-containing protein